MPNQAQKELRLFAASILYVIKGGIIWGAIAFLACAAAVAALDPAPLHESGSMTLAYTTAGIAFVTGSLLYARQVLDITNPAHIAFRPAYRPRVWMWPFILCGWTAILVENPTYLMLGVVAEGLMVAKDFTTKGVAPDDLNE